MNELMNHISKKQGNWATSTEKKHGQWLNLEKIFLLRSETENLIPFWPNLSTWHTWMSQEHTYSVEVATGQSTSSASVTCLKLKPQEASKLQKQLERKLLHVYVGCSLELPLVNKEWDFISGSRMYYSIVGPLFSFMESRSFYLELEMFALVWKTHS